MNKEKIMNAVSKITDDDSDLLGFVISEGMHGFFLSSDGGKTQVLRIVIRKNFSCNASKYTL